MNHFEPEFLNELQVAMAASHGHEVAARCAATETVTLPAASKSAYRKKKTELIFKSNEDDDQCEVRREDSCHQATEKWQAKLKGV